MDNKIKSYSSITINLLWIAALTLTFAFGYNYGKNRGMASVLVNDVTGKAPIAEANADFSPFWQVWKILDERFLSVATNTVKEVSDQDRVWGATAGMVASLNDPHTVFFTPKEAKEFDEEISGNFGGIGAELDRKDGRVIVVAPLKGTPAERAGLKPQDIIVAVNGESTDGWSVSDAVSKIRGEVGTKVTLTILRENEKPMEFTITRAVINIPIIKTETKEGVFIIHLYNFSNPSSLRFKEAMIDFVNSGLNKLVIDLRNNPGGYLDAAVDMASWFVPSGEIVVTEDFKNKKQNVVYRSKGYNNLTKKPKIAILVNEGSASASEILAGALSDYGLATLVGTQTFGKGSVQEYMPMSHGTALKVTIARWLTPKEKSLSNGGLIPDIMVKPSETDKEDMVLKKAIEFLKK